MKKINQVGFTIIEVLLFVLTVSIISFGGYYVWQHKDTDGKKVSSDSSNTKPNVAAKKVLDPYTNWKSYTLQYEKLALSYPADWTVANKGETNFNDYVEVNAPSGFKFTVQSGRQNAFGTPSIVEGDNSSTTFIGSPATLLYLHGGSHLSPNMETVGSATLVSNPDDYTLPNGKNIKACSGCNGVNGPEGSYLYIIMSKEVPLGSEKTDADYLKGKHIIESMHY